jgi:hypothetical protein
VLGFRGGDCRRSGFGIRRSGGMRYRVDSRAVPTSIQSERSTLSRYVRRVNRRWCVSVVAFSLQFFRFAEIRRIRPASDAQRLNRSLTRNGTKLPNPERRTPNPERRPPHSYRMSRTFPRMEPKLGAREKHRTTSTEVSMRRVVYREVKSSKNRTNSSTGPSMGFGSLLAKLGLASSKLTKSRTRVSAR